MLTFLSENLATIIISVALAVLIVLILLKLRKARKKGKSACGCSGCAECPCAGKCHKQLKFPIRFLSLNGGPHFWCGLFFLWLT